MEELEAVERLKNKDREAFDFLYEKYKNEILRAAYFITNNRFDSEDIVQETFVKCYLYAHELRDNSLFKTWLYRILTRTAWRFCKKNGVEKPTDEIFDLIKDSNPCSPADIILQSELEQFLLKEINRLKTKHRTVIVLYYYNQLSTKEIAKVMGCLEGTVKSRLYNARAQLKNSLEKNGPKKEELFYEKAKLI